MTEKKDPPAQTRILGEIIQAENRRYNKVTPEVIDAVQQKLDKPQGKINFPPRFRGGLYFWKTGLPQ